MSKIACMHGSKPGEEMLSNGNDCMSASTAKMNRPVLKLKRVVLVGKVTRYEFEKHRFKTYTEEQFKESMDSRGSDYNALLAQHEKHLQVMSSIENILKERRIEYQVCTRGTAYTDDLVSWADAIITAGGDGTFLSAASKLKDQSKPMIGINTNPNRSEGHLCLPRKYTSDLGKALDQLASGQFRWLWRQRIRITMTGSPVNFRPVRNGDMLQSRMRNRAMSADIEPEYVHLHESITEAVHPPLPDSPGVFSQVLPVLALNEVFIGESLAAIPSYYDLHVNSAPHEEQKSSGICVCTGTGSTAWSYNICRLHKSAVQRVLEIAAGVSAAKGANGFKSSSNATIDDKFVEKVTNAYSQSYIYEPNSDNMLYSVRDPMQNRVFTCEKCNGFAKKLKIRSRCWDAGLCIDGEISYPFNDGAIATLEMLPEDALRTVLLDEDDGKKTSENGLENCNGANST